jgi:hypothetical protein
MGGDVATANRIVAGGLQRQQSAFLLGIAMQFLYKVLALITLVISFIMAVLIAANLESIRAIGWHVERFVADLLTITLYCVGGVGVIGALGALTWIMLMIAKRRNEDMRQRDGSFPLQRVKIGQATVLIDPNKTLAPAMVVSPHGVAEVFTDDPAAYRQQALALSRVSVAQALTPGDNAISSRFGSQFRPAGRAASDRQLIDGKQPDAAKLPAQIATPEPEPPAPPSVAPLRLSAAMNRCTPTELYAGVADDGALAVFNPRQAIHGGIVGASGTGKTASAGYSLVAQALRTGYHVVILDPKGGADWRPWASRTEWCESAPDVFPQQIEALWTEHERRMRLVNASGARSIDDIEQAPPHILVVVEEYGDLIAQLRRGDKRRADDADNLLDRLMRLSRASGIHLLMIDQYPEEWSNQVLANTKWLAAFRLGPNQGAKVREYRADQLPDQGRFIVRGREFNAWHAAPYLDKMLPFVPASAAGPIIDGSFTVRAEARGEATSGELAMNGAMNGAMNTTMNATVNTPSTVSEWYDWTRTQYLPEHPELLQVDASGRGFGVSALARAMARQARGDSSQMEAFKGVASEVARRLRADVPPVGEEAK